MVIAIDVTDYVTHGLSFTGSEKAFFILADLYHRVSQANEWKIIGLYGQSICVQLCTIITAYIQNWTRNVLYFMEIDLIYRDTEIQ